jgi:hypothetical protein
MELGTTTPRVLIADHRNGTQDHYAQSSYSGPESRLATDCIPETRVLIIDSSRTQVLLLTYSKYPDPIFSHLF